MGRWIEYCEELYNYKLTRDTNILGIGIRANRELGDAPKMTEAAQ